MRVRYSFSCRKTGHTENIRKQRIKYPVLLLKVIEISDIVLQILDVRFFDEMRNTEIENLIEKKGKMIINVLNKSDLVKRGDLSKADLEKVKPYVLISSTDRKGIRDLREKIKIAAKKVKRKSTNKYDRIQVGVIGYPNAGKSTLINVLIGKASAGTGAEAGYTRGIQKLRLTSDILLVDSPGVIPNADYSYTDKKKIAKHSMVGGKSFSQIKDPDLVLADIMSKYSKEIEEYYDLNVDGNPELLIEEIGKKRGFLKKGGEIDDDKAARSVIKDFQEGKIIVSI